jgi:hypothetical protein
MLTRIGPGSGGYNFQPEFIMWDCVVLLNSGATLATGQVVSRNCAVFPSTIGADRCVLPNHPNSSPIYGVYQGPPITNTGPAAYEFPVVVMVRGLGVVLCNAPTNAVVAQVQGTYIGQAQATGGVTAQGATIIPVAGPQQTVRCAINCS